MKIFWMLLLFPTLACAMVPAHTQHHHETFQDIYNSIKNSSCTECLHIYTRLAAVATRTVKESEQIVSSKQQTIERLERQIETDRTQIARSNATIRNLTIATCLSGIIAAGLIVKEIIVRNPAILEKISLKA